MFYFLLLWSMLHIASASYSGTICQSANDCIENVYGYQNECGGGPPTRCRCFAGWSGDNCMIRSHGTEPVASLPHTHTVDEIKPEPWHEFFNLTIILSISAFVSVACFCMGYVFRSSTDTGRRVRTSIEKG